MTAFFTDDFSTDQTADPAVYLIPGLSGGAAVQEGRLWSPGGGSATLITAATASGYARSASRLYADSGSAGMFACGQYKTDLQTVVVALATLSEGFYTMLVGGATETITVPGSLAAVDPVLFEVGYDGSQATARLTNEVGS